MLHFLRGVNIRKLILIPRKECKIGSKSPENRLNLTTLSPEFKELERERERRRHEWQEVTINAMAEERSLVKGMSMNRAHDILWLFTGRDIYRMLVIEQGWTSEEYEKWLADLLANTLIIGKNQPV